jgi:hypothetical protein
VAAQIKYCKSVFAALVAGLSTNSSTASSIMSATSIPVPSVPGPSVFMICAPVLMTTPPVHCVLLVPIQAAFPHITLQLGSSLGCKNCPAICCMVVLAAVLTTSNLHFFAALAQAYPHTVAFIHSPSDYSPIMLSGIVQHEGNSVMTNLLVAFRFHLPYLTQEGNPTSFLVATECNVTINTILSLPFIQQTKMVINTADQVAKLCALGVPPFPINFCHAMCAVPPVNETHATANAAMDANIVCKIENIEAYFMTKLPPIKPINSLLPAKQTCCIRFHYISSSDSNASVQRRVSISSTIKPASNDANHVFSLCNISLSA